MNPMAVQEAIRTAGGARALAEALTGKGRPATRQVVEQWARRGAIPAPYVIAVADVTGIPATELAPDVYPADRVKITTAPHSPPSAATTARS